MISKVYNTHILALQKQPQSGIEERTFHLRQEEPDQAECVHQGAVRFEIRHGGKDHRDRFRGHGRRYLGSLPRLQLHLVRGVALRLLLETNFLVSYEEEERKVVIVPWPVL